MDVEYTDAADMRQIVDRVSDPNLERRWAYYVGNHPQVYATPKLASSFRDLMGSMTENYCGVAVGSRVSRMQITGWAGAGAQTAETLWDESRLPQRQDRLWRWALTFGRAWITVSEQDGQQRLEIAPPTRMAGIRDDMNPNQFRVAGQVMQHTKPDGTASKRRTITLYYPDRTLSYTGEGNDYSQFTVVDGSEAAGLGFVPAMEVAPYGDGPALIDEIRPSQDRINKLCSNKLIAAEFGAFRQRVFFTRQQVTDYDLRNVPDNAIVLDPDDGNAKVQEMAATDLANYDNSKNAEIDNLFTIAALPRHLRVNPGSPPSGEAIKADEMPLVEHILNYQREAGEAVTDMLALLGVDAEPVWRNPEPRDQLREAQVVAEYVMMGLPWQAAAQKFAGWSEEDIADAATTAPTGTEPGAELLA